MACYDDGSCVFTTAIHDFVNASTSIYPNPANTSVNILSGISKINTISISSLNGQEMMNIEVNAKQIKINTTNLSQGLYIIDIKSKNTSIKRKLVIK